MGDDKENEELKFQRERLEQQRREHDQNMRLSCVISASGVGADPATIVTRAQHMYEFVKGAA